VIKPLHKMQWVVVTPQVSLNGSTFQTFGRLGWLVFSGWIFLVD